MAALTTVILTAKRISPSTNADLSTPKMVVLEVDKILKVSPFKGGVSVKYGIGRPYKKYRVAETISKYQVAVDPTNPLFAADAATAVAAGGTTQATALQLSKYYNVVTAAVPAASVGLLLPNAVSLSLHQSNGARGVVAIVNSTSDTLSVWPASASHTLDGASATAVTIPAFSRKHFMTSSSVGAWVSAASYA